VCIPVRKLFEDLSVTKAKRDTGAQHADEEKFRHPRRYIGKIRHPHTVDWAARPTWMTELSSAHMLCFCVTLGFFFNNDTSDTPSKT
jgi:hypothetical protein